MILLTGGAGYIGSHIALALADNGIPCVVVDDLSTGHASLIPAGTPFVQGDCADTGLIRDLVARHRVDLVIHCAGRISVAESVVEPLLYYQANVGATMRLVEAASAGGASRMLFSSTATVYGAPDQLALGEDLPLEPVNPYAASKAMAERVLQDVSAAGGMVAGILRYFNVAGADPQGRSGQVSRDATHLIKIASEVAAGKRDHVEVMGNDYPTPDGTGIRDYIHVSDLADAHVAAIPYLRASPDGFVFNIGYGRGHSVLEVLDAFDRVGGRHLPRKIGPRRQGDVARLVADPTAAMAALGWSPRRDRLEDIIADATRWELSLARHDMAVAP